MLPLLLGAQAAGAAEPILIGEIDSRTRILAAQGLAIAEGVRIALDAVNAANGVSGRPLRLLERLSLGEQKRLALILHEVSVTGRSRELVALLGPSGAGKTTLLRAITGLLPIRTGRIRLGATRLDGLRPNRIAALGVAALPESRRLFDELSVGENLAMGAFLPEARRRAAVAQNLVGGLFPALADRQDATVHELSAGEQQMLAVGRTLMASPRCLVLDDPFLGLAPPIRARLARRLRELAADQGLAILAAGQHVRTLLRVAHRAYVLDAGRILVTGTGPELLDNPEVQRTLLDLGRETSA